MRNKINRIKDLEKDVTDLREKNRSLAHKIMEYEEGARQTEEALQAVLGEIAKRYGEIKYEEGEVIGYRLEFPQPKTLAFDIKVQKDNGNYIVGAINMSLNKNDAYKSVMQPKRN